MTVQLSNVIEDVLRAEEFMDFHPDIFSKYLPIKEEYDSIMEQRVGTTRTTKWCGKNSDEQF